MADLPPLHQDALIERLLRENLLPEAGAPPNFVRMRGFLAKSPLPGFDWRYHPPDFTFFVDMEQKDIIYYEQLPENDPSATLGSTILYVRIPVMSGLNDFLKGPVGMFAMGRPMHHTPMFAYGTTWWCSLQVHCPH